MEDNAPSHCNSDNSRLQWARGNIHICPEGRYHGAITTALIEIIISVTLHLELKEQPPTLFLYSVNVLEEVRQWTPTVLVIELRRLNIYAIKVCSETPFDLQVENDITMLSLTKIVEKKTKPDNNTQLLFECFMRIG